MNSRRANTDLLDDGTIEHLVGVIDLKAGLAVHASGGRRDHYRPVASAALKTGAALPQPGSAIALANLYQSLRIGRLYLADLDAIDQQQPQFDPIDRLLRSTDHFQQVLLDIGWRGDEPTRQLSEIERLAQRFPRLLLVAASETMQSIEAFRRLAESIGGQRMVLGLDFRNGQLISSQVAQTDWLSAANQLDCRDIVTLDLSAIGKRDGPATEGICRRIRRRFPDGVIYSGGGIRSASDVALLQQAGCNHCLVATAILENSDQSTLSQA